MEERPLLVDTGRGLSIKYKKRFLYSKFSPEKSVLKNIDQFNFKENTIYLIPSPLLGIGLKNIYSKIPSNSITIQIEIDINLLNISENRDNIEFIQNGFDFISKLNILDFSLFRQIEIIPLNGAYSLYKREYDRLLTIAMNQLHSYWKNRYTLTQMGQLWVKNCLINLKEIGSTQPISNLKTEKPVIIIGAGESSETILKDIQNNRDNFFILCVDTALQILLDVDIIPDAVLALEAQFYNLPDFYGAKDRKIDLIYDLSSYPGVVRNLTGNKYLTVTRFSKSKLLDKLEEKNIVTSFIPPLGSVGISAIYIGLQITKNSIFLAGLDFSYIIGKTHSRGTPYHKLSLLNWTRINSGYNYEGCLKRPLLTKQNKSGLQENSDTILYDYSCHAKELLSESDRVFDLTKTGMSLGVPFVDFKEIRNYYNRETNTIDIDNQKILHTDFVKEEVTKIKELLERIERDDLNNIYEDLNSIAYLFEHYPEKKPLANIDKQKISRIYLTLQRVIRKIR